MNKSDSINELAAALSLAQGEFTSAKMDKTNPFLKNKYADLGSVISAAKASCAKYGLSVAQPANCNGDFVTVTTLLMHKSGQWISDEMMLPVGKESGRSVAQSAGSIITYLRRYSLSAMLGIYADEDTDGNKPENNTPATAYTAPAAVVHDVPPMTIQEAQDVTNRDGIRYGDLDNEKLAVMANSLAKLAKRTPEQETKLLAIQLIFAARREEARDVDGLSGDSSDLGQ